MFDRMPKLVWSRDLSHAHFQGKLFVRPLGIPPYSFIHSFIHSFIPFYFRPLAHKQKNTKDTKTNTQTDTNQTNKLRKLPTNLLHEVDQLVSKAYLQLLMMVHTKFELSSSGSFQDITLYF